MKYHSTYTQLLEASLKVNNHISASGTDLQKPQIEDPFALSQARTQLQNLTSTHS